MSCKLPGEICRKLAASWVENTTQMDGKVAGIVTKETNITHSDENTVQKCHHRMKHNSEHKNIIIIIIFLKLSSLLLLLLIFIYLYCYLYYIIFNRCQLTNYFNESLYMT